MRVKARIPILWDIFMYNTERVLKFLVKDGYVDAWARLQSKPELKEVWLKNPDWRFVQLLENESIIPSSEFYNVEDERLFVLMGVADAREVCLWGSVFNKKGERLKEMVFTPLCKMEDSHIEKVLKHNEENGFYVSNYFLMLLTTEKEIREVKRQLKRGEITEEEAKFLIEGLITEQNK